MSVLSRKTYCVSVTLYDVCRLIERDVACPSETLLLLAYAEASLRPKSHACPETRDVGLQLYVQKVLCSEGPMFRRFYAQKVLCSEGSMFRRLYVQKVLYSEGSMFRRSYVQKYLFRRSYV